MCDRIVLRTPASLLAEHFGVTGPPPNWPARYNVGPGVDVPLVRRHPKEGDRRLDFVRWGLVPADTSDPAVAKKQVNAQTETVGRMPPLAAL